MKKNLLAISILAFAFCIRTPHASAALLFPRSTQIATGAVTFTYGDQTFTADAATVESWRGSVSFDSSLSLSGQAPAPLTLLQTAVGANKKTVAQIQNLDFRPAAIYTYIKTLAQGIDHAAVEPSLTIDGNKATAFTEPQDGLAVDIYNSTMTALGALESGQNTIALTVADTKPKGSLSALNDLGINDLLARGTSSFKGSPNNRRHNIKIGVEKMTGIIIPPGGTFSFNDNLGPVEKEEGFLPELVIKGSEGTIPELGGGLCQVSSTTFRAAMAAGLPILQRRNHAYAVSYYSPQGTDATIYPGVVDLKFQNNTPGSILVWPSFTDANTLVFDLWGTQDDRQVTLEKPVVYDRKSDGSMKADWTRVITKDGETSSITFHSVYASPALYHKTEQFVPAATSTPATAPKVN